MLWIFVTIGLIALSAALYGLAISVRFRRRPDALCGAALALVIVAWAAGHTTVMGWAALLAAACIELLHWIRSTKAAPASSEDPPPAVSEEHETTKPKPAAPDAMAAAPPVEPRMPAPPLSTFVLLTAPWQAAPDVFLASLRRAGQRDARLATSSANPESSVVRVGPLTLTLEAVADPVSSDQINYAADQTWDWPQAAQGVAGHVAHVVITVCMEPEEGPRTELGVRRVGAVRLQHRAHAALAEFAPVVAALWPDAGRLVPVAGLARLAREAAEASVPTAACINFRTFPLDEAGGVLSDTVGLHAFDLPDVQVITDGEPGAAVSAVLYELADRFFQIGCDITDGQRVSSEPYGAWRATHTVARFPPRRGVIQLSPIIEESPEGPQAGEPPE